MYRRIFIALIVSVGCSVAAPAWAVEGNSSSTKSMVVELTPVVVHGQTGYLSASAVVFAASWKVRQWRRIQLPDAWGDADLRLVLLNDTDLRLKLFPTQLPTSTIDISMIDPSHYPSLRLLVLQTTSHVSWPATEITFIYTESFNSRLLVLLILVTLMFLGLLIGTIRWRVTPRMIWSQSELTIRQPRVSIDGPTMVSLGWLIVMWSAVVAIPLGSFSNPIQILYLFVKLPFLFLCTFIISLFANVVMAKLIGVAAGIRVLIAHAIQILSLTAITMAALSPILWWLRLSHQGHDVALIWSLGIFSLSFLVGIWRLGQQYRQFGSSWPFIPVILWAAVYGFVLLQLGWLLRPWVGTIDPISQTVPFSRLYSGNVFQEIFSTFHRLTQ